MVIFSFFCRGESHQRAVKRNEVDAVTDHPTPFKNHLLVEEMNQPYSLSSRNYQDTLIAYATLPGYVAYRDEHNGSWFLQILCEVFMNYAHEKHIQDLFTMVSEENVCLYKKLLHYFVQYYVYCFRLMVD